MNVSYRCPKCDQSVRVPFTEHSTELVCAECEDCRPIPAKAVCDGQVTKCLICSCEELYVRKNFSQRIGIAIIVTGFAISTVTWFFRMPLLTFGILFATALVNVVLYVTVGNLLQCYRCHSEYREISGIDEHAAFSLETHERFRQQAARAASPQHVEQTNSK